MRKTQIFLILLVILVPVGAYCFQQEKDRKYTFDVLFPAWMKSQYVCGDTAFFETILDKVAPDELIKINDTDTYFAELERKEHDGTLTVGERQKYLAHNMRVSEFKGVGWIGEAIKNHEDNNGLIKRCPRPEYLDMKEGRVRAYCKGRVRHEFQWSMLSDEYYKYLFWTNQADNFIDRMRSDLGKDRAYALTAKENILARAANSVSGQEVEDIIHQEFINLKCESGSSSLDISDDVDTQTMNLNEIEVNVTDIKQAYECTPSLVKIGGIFLSQISKNDKEDEGYIHNTAQFLYRGYGLSKTLKQLAPEPLKNSWEKTSGISFDEHLEYALHCVSIYNNWREIGAITEDTQKQSLLKTSDEIQSALSR